MSAITLDSIDHALQAARWQWHLALAANDMDRARKVSRHLDELLDQRSGIIYPATVQSLLPTCTAQQ